MAQTFFSSEMHEYETSAEGERQLNMPRHMLSDRLNIFLYFWGTKHGLANSASWERDPEDSPTSWGKPVRKKWKITVPNTTLAKGLC